MKNKNLYLIWTWRHDGCFWRDNRARYTEDINQAGAYTFEEAADICTDGFPGSKVMIGSSHAQLLIGKSMEEIVKILIQWRTL